MNIRESQVESQLTTESLPEGVRSVLLVDLPVHESTIGYQVTTGAIVRVKVLLHGPTVGTGVAVHLPGRDEAEPLLGYLLGSSPPENADLSPMRRVHLGRIVEGWDPIFRMYERGIASDYALPRVEHIVEDPRQGRLGAAIANFVDKLTA